jgi:hypothetical protein
MIYNEVVDIKNEHGRIKTVPYSEYLQRTRRTRAKKAEWEIVKGPYSDFEVDMSEHEEMFDDELAQQIEKFNIMPPYGANRSRLLELIKSQLVQRKGMEIMYDVLMKKSEDKQKRIDSMELRVVDETGSKKEESKKKKRLDGLKEWNALKIKAANLSRDLGVEPPESQNKDVLRKFIEDNS